MATAALHSHKMFVRDLDIRLALDSELFEWNVDAGSMERAAYLTGLYLPLVVTWIFWVGHGLLGILERR